MSSSEMPVASEATASALDATSKSAAIAETIAFGSEALNEKLNETLNETLHETLNKTLHETLNETVHETLNETLSEEMFCSALDAPQAIVEATNVTGQNVTSALNQAAGLSTSSAPGILDVAFHTLQAEVFRIHRGTTSFFNQTIVLLSSVVGIEWTSSCRINGSSFNATRFYLEFWGSEEDSCVGSDWVVLFIQVFLFQVATWSFLEFVWKPHANSENKAVQIASQAARHVALWLFHTVVATFTVFILLKLPWDASLAVFQRADGILPFAKGLYLLYAAGNLSWLVFGKFGSFRLRWFLALLCFGLDIQSGFDSVHPLLWFLVYNESRASSIHHVTTPIVMLLSGAAGFPHVGGLFILLVSLEGLFHPVLVINKYVQKMDEDLAIAWAKRRKTWEQEHKPGKKRITFDKNMPTMRSNGANGDSEKVSPPVGDSSKGKGKANHQEGKSSPTAHKKSFLGF